jgi:hypothetical protein
VAKKYPRTSHDSVLFTAAAAHYAKRGTQIDNRPFAVKQNDLAPLLVVFHRRTHVILAHHRDAHRDEKIACTV